ncbi:MAG: hypothetical protein ACYS15_09865 [Planctomycetota bacterium]|jgi:hypothetical protein
MSEREHVDQPELEADTLIGRIIDREATSGDCESFERMASVDPILWRALALRHLDMVMLSDRVGEQTDAAERVELRSRWQHRPALNLLVTLSGWAAVFVVGVWWAIVVAGGGNAELATSPVQSVAGPPAAVGALTPAEHYDEYLEAEFVLGELDPILLETEPLPDGRYRLRFIRRIEEYVVIDAPTTEIIDDTGGLTVDPAELRRDTDAPDG